MTSAKRKEGTSKDDSPTKKLRKEHSEAEASSLKTKKSVPAAQKAKKTAKTAKQESVKAQEVPSEDPTTHKKAKKPRQTDDAERAPKPKRIKQQGAAVTAAVSTRDAEAVKADVEMEDVPGLSSKRTGKKRRRKNKAEEEASLPAEEQQRRQRQRELRDLALNLRAGGKKYIRPKKRLATEAGKAEASKGQTAKPPAKASDEQSFAGKEETGSRPTGPIQIIVVPIYWNRKPEEKAVVIKAAEQLVDLIATADIKVGLDTTNALSPGQKFAHWEGKGVKVRVELGPRDVAKGDCVLAVVTTPGQLAQKQTVKVGLALLQAATKALGVDLPEAAAELASSSFSAQTAKQSKAFEGGSQPSKMVIDAKPTTGIKQPLFVSGDDLGGDFADLTFDGEENTGRKKKSKP